jgi:hypothetical protein
MPVPHGTKARKNLHLKKESVVALGSAADSVEMERVSTARIRNTLAEEDRLVAGAPKMLCQVAIEIFRGAIRLAE